MKLVGVNSRVAKVLSEFFTEQELKDLESVAPEDIMDLAVQFGNMDEYDVYCKEIFDAP